MKVKSPVALPTGPIDSNVHKPALNLSVANSKIGDIPDESQSTWLMREFCGYDVAHESANRNTVPERQRVLIGQEITPASLRVSSKKASPHLKRQGCVCRSFGEGDSNHDEPHFYHIVAALCRAHCAIPANTPRFANSGEPDHPSASHPSLRIFFHVVTASETQDAR